MSDMLLWKICPCSPVSVYIRVKRKRNTSETESDSGGNPYSAISNFWSKCVILKADWEPRPLEDVALELKSTEALNLDSLIWQSCYSKHHPQVLFTVCSRFIWLLHKWLYIIYMCIADLSSYKTNPSFFLCLLQRCDNGCGHDQVRDEL